MVPAVYKSRSRMNETSYYNVYKKPSTQEYAVAVTAQVFLILLCFCFLWGGGGGGGWKGEGRHIFTWAQ